ncbi:LiaF transmembrane domain-containing protein [Paenibacillus assamensis]|uniref:LiaF transmembrane domain-containing protein n=1 Tax=Paenibacillus assamensis TaxID=311244 RepID=UPI000412EF1E|nr:hypothetical protein [Paenibacillus assamensis]
MERKGNTIALLLIGIGGIILLSKLGWLLGGLMEYLIPIALIALGYYGVKAGNRFFGGLFIIIGAFSLIGELAWFIGLIIAIAMIGFGVKMLKNRRDYRY